MSGGNSKPNDHFSVTHMGVSKKRAIPKWMVYTGNPYFLMDDLGVPLFLETPIYLSSPNNQSLRRFRNPGWKGPSAWKGAQRSSPAAPSAGCGKAVATLPFKKVRYERYKTTGGEWKQKKNTGKTRGCLRKNLWFNEGYLIFEDVA